MEQVGCIYGVAHEVLVTLLRRHQYDLKASTHPHTASELQLLVRVASGLDQWDAAKACSMSRVRANGRVYDGHTSGIDLSEMYQLTVDGLCMKRSRRP